MKTGADYLNESLGNVTNMVLGYLQNKRLQEQQQRQGQMDKLSILSNLLNATGNPAFFKGIQDAGKGMGINIPDLQSSGGTPQTPSTAPQAPKIEQSAEESGASNAIAQLLSAFAGQIPGPMQSGDYNTAG